MAGDVQINKEFKELKPPLMKMVKKYTSTRDGHLGRITVARHRIDLNATDAPSIHSALYRAGPKQGKLGRKKIENMEEICVAESAVTEWASPAVFVPKIEGSLRFCVTYRQLNATARDSYHIPRMDECFNSLGKA